MAVSQSQVDQIIASASSDDPEVKLLQLQDEVDLIKTSIKRLLIDIRERLNDLENPIVSSMANAFHDTSSDTEAAKNENRTSTDVKKADQTAVHDIPQHEGEVSQKQEDAPKPHPTNDSSHEPLHAQTTGQPGRYDAELLASIKSQIAALPKEDENAKASIADKVRLQKVYRLFQWTARNVKRFGHDRVDLMLDAYHAMGYISDKSCKLVKDMSRLMPASIGEMHEIQAEEFVSELYELNHILNPSDSTLDRDMIEVLMEKRERKKSQKVSVPGQQQEENAEEQEYLPSRERF